MPKRKKNRSRRTLDQQVADLEAQLADLRTRAAAQEKFDPKAVKAERKRLGLSAKRYAALVGVWPLTIYLWERGETMPRPAQLDLWLAVRGIGKAEAYKKLKLEDLSKERGKFSAKAVHAERRRLGLSARDYGRLVGVTLLTIYNWEKGKSEPRDRELRKWLSVRGIDKQAAQRKLRS